MSELNVVLVEPEIPQNTGNIARTCAATGARLHLVRPLGFSISEKAVKRAGLDYWNLLDITVYDSIADFFEKTKGGQYYYFSTKARHIHSDISYPDGAYLLFVVQMKGITKFCPNDETHREFGDTLRKAAASGVTRHNSKNTDDRRGKKSEFI